MNQKHNVSVAGLNMQFSTGSIANLAGGAVFVTVGETNVQVTACAAQTMRPGQDFFPLTVDYRDKYAAAGRFPGGYFKREGRPSEREILIFDVPGIGRSEMSWRPRRFSGLARLANKLLDRLGYQRVDVVGVSWGGALAQQFARQYPDRCRRLVLAATSPGAVMVPWTRWADAPIAAISSRRQAGTRFMGEQLGKESAKCGPAMCAGQRPRMR